MRRYGEVCGDMRRYGEMWGDVRRLVACAKRSRMPLGSASFCVIDLAAKEAAFGKSREKSGT